MIRHQTSDFSGVSSPFPISRKIFNSNAAKEKEAFVMPLHSAFSATNQFTAFPSCNHFFTVSTSYFTTSAI